MGVWKNSGSGFWLSRNFYVGLLPFLNIGFGDDLSFREATLRVLLAMKVFTTVFGMGTGGVLSLCHRKTFVVSWRLCGLQESFSSVGSCIMMGDNLWCVVYLFSGKALVRLVMLGCVCCQISTCILSTLCSATGLTSLGCERSHLTVGFALICFQRLSAWNTATGRLPLAG